MGYTGCNMYSIVCVCVKNVILQAISCGVDADQPKSPNRHAARFCARTHTRHNPLERFWPRYVCVCLLGVTRDTEEINGRLCAHARNRLFLSASTVWRNRKRWAVGQQRKQRARQAVTRQRVFEQAFVQPCVEVTAGRTGTQGASAGRYSGGLLLSAMEYIKRPVPRLFLLFHFTYFHSIDTSVLCSFQSNTTPCEFITNCPHSFVANRLV